MGESLNALLISDEDKRAEVQAVGIDKAMRAVVTAHPTWEDAGKPLGEFFGRLKFAPETELAVAGEDMLAVLNPWPPGASVESLEGSIKRLQRKGHPFKFLKGQLFLDAVGHANSVAVARRIDEELAGGMDASPPNVEHSELAKKTSEANPRKVEHSEPPKRQANRVRRKSSTASR